MRGRVSHEAIFNVANGSFRSPSTQQGYSPFTTWTRGLAWAILGFAEQLEFLATVDDDALERVERAEPRSTRGCSRRRARPVTTTSRHAAAADGLPYWDTGAPGLAALGDWGGRAADPFNDLEPVDSSAAAIASQGLLRLARVLAARGEDGSAYEQAGLRTLDTLFNPADLYLATDPAHEGLLLHSVYHWPNRWDHVPAGARTPRGESSQWGDYHAREAALYVRRLARGEPYLAFFGAGIARPACPRAYTDRRACTVISPRARHLPAIRVALVTGGTRGIGLGVCRSLAREGWGLALCGLRPEDAVQEVLAELRRWGRPVATSRPTWPAPRIGVRLVDQVSPASGQSTRS